MDEPIPGQMTLDECIAEATSRCPAGVNGNRCIHDEGHYFVWSNAA